MLSGSVYVTNAGSNMNVLVVVVGGGGAHPSTSGGANGKIGIWPRRSNGPGRQQHAAGGKGTVKSAP